MDQPPFEHNGNIVLQLFRNVNRWGQPAFSLLTVSAAVVATVRSPGSILAEAVQGRRGLIQFVSFDLGKIEETPNFVRDLRKEFGPLFGAERPL